MRNYTDLSKIEVIKMARRLKYAGLGKVAIAQSLNITARQLDLIFNNPHASSDDLVKRVFNND